MADDATTIKIGDDLTERTGWLKCGLKRKDSLRILKTGLPIRAGEHKPATKAVASTINARESSTIIK